jgi:hypothetical protein
MSKGSVSSRNKEMAKYLKDHNVRRTTCNCPVCHRQVGLSNLEGHLMSCKGKH